MTILVNPFRAGSGIDINYNTGTIANSGVLSVDSNTGNLTLSAGTGISISGLTITNTGVDSLVAGTGISLSATTGSVTVTNSGVTSFQGDTGSISLSAGTGISISGLTISNAGVTSLQSETGALSLTAGTGISISGLTITNTGITSLTAGNGISVSGSTISMSGSYSGDFTADGTITSDTSSGNNFYVEYNATLGASQSDVLWFDIEGYINGNEELSLYSKYSTNSSSDLSDIFFGIYSFDLSSDVLTLDLFSGEMQSYKNILDDGTGNLEIGNFYYKWSNSANNYVYADTGNMVFGTNGGFQWKNSSGTLIAGISSSGDFSISDQLTIGDETIISPSNGYIGSGQNLAPTTLVTTSTSYPLGFWAFNMYDTSGYPSPYGYLLSMASVEDRNSMAQMYFSWTGYGTQNGSAGEDAYAWIRTNRDSNNEFGSFQQVVLLQQNGDLYLGSYNSVAYGSGDIYTSGNISASGSLTVTDDVTTESSFVAIGNGFNPSSSVDTANIQSGNSSNAQAYGGGVILKDQTYYAGLWTNEDGATLELGAGGSATSISAQLSVNTSSVSIAGSLTVGSSLTVNGVSFADMAIQLLASNTGGVTFPPNTYNIVASFGSFYVGSNSSIYVSCLGMEYNSGGGANQYLIISDTALTVGDSYSSVTYALELTGAAGQTTDSTTSTLFFGSSGVSVTAGAEYYVYYGTALTHYTHYLTYATALISFQ